MKLKKILAVAAACAVTALSAAVFAVNSVSAATVVGKAFLNAKMGTSTQISTVEALSNGSTMANIDGNAQYEVTWNVKNPGTTAPEFIALQIEGADTSSQFTSAKYPNLKVTVDEVYVDGTKASYTSSPNSANYNYLDAGVGKTRVYLLSTLSDPQLCSDLVISSAPQKTVRVVFTVSGLDTAGTSNVNGNPLTTDPTFATEAPTLNPGLTTQTEATTAGIVFGNSTQSDSASTGDVGVAVAVAGLVITAGIGATAVALRPKKK